MTADRNLKEREKELACIHSICLLAAEAPDPQAAAEGVAEALRAAMERDALAVCSVSFRNAASGAAVFARRGGTESGAPPPDGRDRPARIEAALPAGAAGAWTGEISIEYPEPGLRFLPQEKALLGSVLVVMASMLRTASLIAELRSATADLTAKNIALREVLSAIEAEKRSMRLAFRERLVAEILPLAERARDPSLSAERRAAYLGLLVDELGRELPGREAVPLAASLSPREREVAVQVRNGRTSKEIAELLGIAEATVERHRHNIRRKLRIANEDVNLASLLGSEGSSREGMTGL